MAAPAGSAVAHVADGQQRLLTASIFYAVARDLSPPEDAKQMDELVRAPANGAPRFRPRDRDAAFLQEWVQTPGATLRPFMPTDASETQATEDPEAELSESQRNIIANRDMLVERLKSLGAEGLRALTGYLASAPTSLSFTAPTIEEARNAYASTRREACVKPTPTS